MKTMNFMVMYLCAFWLSAQQDSTIYLEEVEILGSPLTEYSAGTSISSIQLGPSASVDGIGNETASYFRLYGNGQLSTLTLRGTSSSHTNVIWNGMPTNSPTLGQTDFSIWPAFLTDKLIVQKGSTSSLFGSGSIGGNVIIENSLIRKDSLATLYSSIGSFGQQNYGGKFQVNITPNLISETRIFHGAIENDFPYELRRETIRQPNARVERLGVSQKFGLRSEKHYLFSEVAFARNNRQIQPTVTSSSRDQLLTENLRAVLSNEVFFNNSSLYTSIGMINESTLYNRSSRTESTQFAGSVFYHFSVGKYIKSKSGINSLLARSKSGNYRGRQTQNEFHLFSSWTIQPSNRLKLTLNLREAFHEENTVFVPSFGGEWSILDTSAELKLKGQVSKGYRVPTFNDRFWQPGGNPDLNAETSKSYELGFDLGFLKQRNGSLSITLFQSDVDEWIQWVPVDGVWSPFNLRKVESKGLEASSNFQFKISELDFSWSGAYEFTLSSDESFDGDNQLPYVPKHSLYNSISVTNRAGEARIRSNYTGERFTTLSNSEQGTIDDFVLVDLLLSKHFKTTLASFDVGFSINNLFDTYYENLINTAMPGRNYLIELTIKH